MTWGEPTAWRAFYRECVTAVWSSPRVLQQVLLPLERGGHNGIEVVQPGLPTQLGPDTLGAGYQGGRVAGTPGLFLDVETLPRDALDAFEHLPDAVAVAVTHIQDGGAAAAAKVGECVEVGCGQVLHVDVVPDSRAVSGGIVGAEDRYMRPFAHRGLDGNFHQQGGFGRGLTDAA